MPKCIECNNSVKFITAYIEFEVGIYEGDRCVDTYSGDRDRLDDKYPPECVECGSTKIEGYL